jgi:hypothetical protein
VLKTVSSQDVCSTTELPHPYVRELFGLDSRFFGASPVASALDLLATRRDPNEKELTLP